jgi:hypothetical protein
MDPVSAPDGQRLAVLESAIDERVAVLARATDDDLTGVAQLQRERCVQDVRGGEPVVDPPSFLADRVGHDVDERGHVMARGPLPLLDRLDREGGALAAGPSGVLRDDPLPGQGLGRRQLDLEPALHAAFGRPDRADLRSGVPRDHVKPPPAASSASRPGAAGYQPGPCISS